MTDILIEGPRLLLKKAAADDLDFILALQKSEDNNSFIVPFSAEFHTKTIAEPKAAMDIIVAEKATEESVGYFHVNGLTTATREMEWTHVIIAKKGNGYGHEAMKLIKKWAFDTLGFHRAWLDCKDYNARALHLYESEGLVREGLIRETILIKGIYENLVILGMLNREYQARKRRGLELN